MKISIITASCNSGSTILECIKSVYSQTYSDKEYIIIDGGSTDTTIEIIKSNSDKIFSFTSGKDSGIYDALNKGIRRSTGDIIAFLHSDDMYADKNVLSKVAAAFDKSDSDCVYGDLVYFRQNNSSEHITRYWEAGIFKKDMIAKGWMPPHPSLFVKKEIYDKYGLFDLRYKISADYDMVLRLFNKYNIKSYYIPEVLVKMRAGGVSNKSIKNIIQKSSEDYMALKSNNISNPMLSLFLKNITKLPQLLTTD